MRFPNHGLAALGLALALASPAGSPMDATAEPAKGIVVGEGVGGVKLGMTAAQVTAAMGQPEQTNKDGERVVYMSFSKKDIFGVYFEGSPATVRMLIVAEPGHCTKRGICLGKAGEIGRLKSVYGDRVVRFKEADGEESYRILNRFTGKRSVLTAFSPGADNSTIPQVTMLYWDGAITDSAMDGDAPAPRGARKK